MHCFSEGVELETGYIKRYDSPVVGAPRSCFFLAIGVAMNVALLNSQPTSQPPVVSPPAAAVAHHRGGVLFCRLVSTSVRCGVIRTMRCLGILLLSCLDLSVRAREDVTRERMRKR